MFSRSVKVSPMSACSKEEESVLADEEALTVRLGFLDSDGARQHLTLAVLMRTPGEDVALCMGLLFARSLIQSADDVMDIDVSRENFVRIELNETANAEVQKLLEEPSPEADKNDLPEAIKDNQFQMRADYLGNLQKNLRLKQDLFHSTGGTSSCGLFDDLGVVLEVAEDIELLNAVHKLLGHLLLNDSLPLRKHGLLVSACPSYNLVQLALQARCPMLVGFGPPSSLALESAQKTNMTLLAINDEESFNIYHDDERIII